MGSIILILWFTLSLNAFINYAPLMKELPFWDKIVAGLVFTLGGPVFGLNQIFTAILDVIFPEGWDDDDEHWI